MPTAKAAASVAKLVPSAAESSAATKTGRVRLSRALAAKPAEKFARLATPTILPKPHGGKPKKPKLRSNRYTIPVDEYAQLAALKQRLLSLGVSVRKSELLRAGLMLLVAMDDARLKKVVAKVEIVKAKRRPSGKAS